MVDRVAVVDDQRDGLGESWLSWLLALCSRCLGLGLRISRRAQGVISPGDRGCHFVDITGRADITVLALEYGVHDRSKLVGWRQCMTVQSVEDEVGCVGLAFVQRCLVGGAHDGAGTITLIEPEAGHILPAHLRVGAQAWIVGQAFEIEAFDLERLGLLAHHLIKGCAKAASAARGRRGQRLQIGKGEVWRVQQDGERVDLALGVFADEQFGDETKRHRVRELALELVDLSCRHQRELRPHDRLDLFQRCLVGVCQRAAQLADLEHVRPPGTPARWRRSRSRQRDHHRHSRPVQPQRQNLHRVRGRDWR